MSDESSSRAARILVRATYPRQLIVYDDASGRWYPLNDSTEDNRKRIITIEYLAVSYRQSDFPDKVKLEEDIRTVCYIRNLHAYWLDFSCTGLTQEEKNEDLYRIADVFRFAKETVIMIPDLSGDGWKSWGGRVWTYPEALLSRKHLCKEGTRKVREVTLFEVDNLAYGNEEGEHRLVALYGTGGKDFSTFRDRFQDLCLAIWERNSGPGSTSTAALLSQFTALPGERVYALMGFLQKRILPDPNETEGEAFDRLLIANSLECDFYPWDALRTKKKFVVRNIGTVKDHQMTSVNSNTNASVNIPYISAAKYNDSQCAIKSICEEGTRVATLASIYEWLEQGSISEKESGSPVFWIYGLAGSGKSTIAKTVAEYCDRKNILGATFFCSRFNSECSNKFNIFTTISYQLCQRYDAFKGAVLEELKKDTDLARADLLTQLEKLIILPLRAMKQMTQIAIIIDALDECSDDKPTSDLLEALNRYATDLYPLKFIISSRPEDNIRSGFRILDLSAHVNKRNLDEISLSEANEDIRKYLKANLQIMKELSLTDDDIEAIIERSQGLFIFASTTVRFLQDKKFRDPVGQLKHLLVSTAPSSDTSPYARLDKLYVTILEEKFSSANNSLLSKLKTALSILITTQEPLTLAVLEAFMPETNIHATFQDLHSLVYIPERKVHGEIDVVPSEIQLHISGLAGEDVVDEGSIRLIHPSFRDFLVNEKRCTRRFVIERPNNVLTRCCVEQLLLFQDPGENITVWKVHNLEDQLLYIFGYTGDSGRGMKKVREYVIYHLYYHLDLFAVQNYGRIAFLYPGSCFDLAVKNFFYGKKKFGYYNFSEISLQQHLQLIVLKFVLSKMQPKVRVKLVKEWPIVEHQSWLKKRMVGFIRSILSFLASATARIMGSQSSTTGSLSREREKLMVLVNSDFNRPLRYFRWQYGRSD